MLTASAGVVEVCALRDAAISVHSVSVETQHEHSDSRGRGSRQCLTRALESVRAGDTPRT